ncbi:MAG: translocation/assembly module TamB domain-containing protein [bacterium]
MARLRWGRGVLVFFSCVSVLMLVAAGAVYVVSGTNWGHERIRRYAEPFLGRLAHGKATIGSLSGNLLVGMTVHDVVITDSAGAPFASAESFSANYSLISLWQKRIWIENAVVVRPRVLLDRPPVGPWNWQHIFPHDTTPKTTVQQGKWGDWVRFTNATVVNAQLVVRTPWHPSERLSVAGQDSAIRSALAGTSRLMIARVGTGFQKTVQLDSVSATIPLLRISEPGRKDRLLEVSALSMIAFPFRPPGAVVRDLKGIFPFNNDSVWWKRAFGTMPHSTASGNGRYDFTSGDLSVTLHSKVESLVDTRWIYPRLSIDGHGNTDIAIEWHGAVQDYQMSNVDFAVGDAHTAGSFGITLDDSITIHNTDLQVTGLETRTLEQIIPKFSSPRQGRLAGRVVAHGGRHALDVNMDITFDDRRAGVSHVVAVGEVGFLDPGGLRARDLKLQLRPVQVDMARTWDPSLPLSGVITGSATVNGSTTSRLVLALDLDHSDRGARSIVAGTATVGLTGGKFFDIDVTAAPISLVEVGRFAPAAGLQGTAVGPLHLVGSLDNLHVQADLALPDGGRFTTQGTLDLASKEKGYDLTATLSTVNLRTVDSKAPITSLTAHAAITGHGTDPATMHSTIAADFSTSRWDSVAVDSLSVRATLADGVAAIKSLYAHGAHTTATASGAFGIAEGHTGDLAYKIAVDSLGAFNRWIPGAPTTAVAVAPRPGVLARALRRARADSARIDRATEMERMINGRPPPSLKVIAPKAVPADTLSGTMSAAGTLHGNPYDFDLRGHAAGDSIVARGNYVRRLQSDYTWTHARTPQAALAVTASADSASVMGFAFDSITASVTYAAPGGHAEVAVTQGGNRQYTAKGEYALNPDRKELRLAGMAFRFDTASWNMTRPSMIQWGGPGIQVTDLELRNRGNGRIYANGLLPTDGVADFKLDVDNFPVSNIVDIVQTDIDMTGVITLHGSMAGTLSTPSFNGTFGLVDAKYSGTAVPELQGRFAYADQALVTHVDALRKGGPPMVVVDGRVPINLALSGVTGTRLLAKPVSLDLVADSLPLELIPEFTDMVTAVHGRAAGKMTLRGTVKQPALVGGFTLDHGAMTLAATGATISNIGATVRMANDTVYVDSIAGSAQGSVRVRGTMAVGDWREPSLNMFLVSEGAELLNNDRGKLRMDAGLALSGPFKDAYLSGAINVTQGVFYAPEPTGRHTIGAGDPALFNVIDTAVASDREIFPVQSPLLANLRVDVALNVKHNTWVRNREANVEVFTEDPISIHAEQQALTLTGAITTDRGEYSFLSKRFQVKRGSAIFIGSPDLNPTLQVTGEYQVQIAGRAVNISVIIGGTMKRPKLALESDAQPPKTQSELLSLLAFGQAEGSLLAFNSSSIAGSAATNDLFGVGAQLAVQRLASVALGVAVDQMEVQAGRALGTDVLDITPGDIPLFTGGSGLSRFFTETKFEAGKYINPRTFISAQEQAGRPGFGIEHRTADGWRFNASIEPRILLNEPTLNQQTWRTVPAIGGFVIREWRF